jgi:hypothetical protein
MGPESDTFSLLKGKLVRVWPFGCPNYSETWVGRLIWVDRFTLGLAFDDGHREIESIIYKPVARIELATVLDGTVTEREGNDRGATNAG